MAASHKPATGDKEHDGHPSLSSSQERRKRQRAERKKSCFILTEFVTAITMLQVICDQDFFLC